MEKTPKFKTAKEEAEFWETHSPLEFPAEFEEVKEPIVDRRARKKGIYIRMDPEAIKGARSIGAHLGIGYQTLFRMWIMEGLSQHLSQTLWGPGAREGPVSVAEVFAELSPEEQQLLRAGLRRVWESKVSNPESHYGVRELKSQRGRRPSQPG